MSPVRFWGYRQTEAGDCGYAEKNHLFRQFGDSIVMINDTFCWGMTFAEVKAMISVPAEGSRKVFLRMLHWLPVQECTSDWMTARKITDLKQSLKNLVFEIKEKGGQQFYVYYPLIVDGQSDDLAMHELIISNTISNI